MAKIAELCRQHGYEATGVMDAELAAYSATIGPFTEEEAPTDPGGYDNPTPILPPAEDAGRYSEADPERTPTVVIAPKRRE